MTAISFARGAPSPECLDVPLLAECAAAALARDGRTILSYGTGWGYGPLRELLAERHGVDPGRVFLTVGGLQGFVFYAAVQLELRPGRVLVEAPTYDRPLKILRRHGAEVVALPARRAAGGSRSSSRGTGSTSWRTTPTAWCASRARHPRRSTCSRAGAA